MTAHERSEPQEHGQRRVPAKLIGALVLVVLLVVFWAENRTRTKIVFYGFDAHTSVWIALAVSAVVGFAIGLLVSHRGRE